MAVGGGQRLQLAQLGPEAGVPSRGGASNESLRWRAEGAELFLRRGSRPDRPPRFRTCTAVVRVDHGGFAGGDHRVVGNHLPGVGIHDQDRPEPATTCTLVPIRVIGTE